MARDTVRLKLLNGATAAGAIGSGMTQGAGDGSPFELDYVYLAAAWQIEFPNGAPTTLAGSILALIDGVTWGQLATFTQATASGLITPFPYPLCVRAVKANISAITGPQPVNLYLAGWF
jgi:hypothetical protein